MIATPTPTLIPVSTLREALARDLSRGTSDLPTLPRGVADALRLARKPALDFSEIEKVAGEYPPLAARLLAVANSALYAMRGVPRIASVRRAAIRMGIQATRDVLYQVAYATMFVDAPRFRELIEATFLHGVRCAPYGRLLAGERGLDQDTAFLAGLLHDIGRARCWKIVAAVRGKVDVEAAEVAVDEFHAVAGSELAAAWHLPEEVIEACRWHHDPADRTYALIAAASDDLAILEVTRDDPGPARASLSALGLLPAHSDEVIDIALAGGMAVPA
jgi:putative nucleotidyltransferase with HDIG domain